MIVKCNWKVLANHLTVDHKISIHNKPYNFLFLMRFSQNQNTEKAFGPLAIVVDGS